MEEIKNLLPQVGDSYTYNGINHVIKSIKNNVVALEVCDESRPNDHYTVTMSLDTYNQLGGKDNKTTIKNTLPEELPTAVTNFERLVNEMVNIYKRKNADYGNSFDKSLDEHGLIASIVRMEDKFNRIKQLYKSKKAKVTDESIVDTLIDLANYAVMTAVWVEK